MFSKFKKKKAFRHHLVPANPFKYFTHFPNNILPTDWWWRAKLVWVTPNGTKQRERGPNIAFAHFVYQALCCEFCLHSIIQSSTLPGRGYYHHFTNTVGTNSQTAQISQETFPDNVAIKSQGRNVSSDWPDSKSVPFPSYPSATDGEKHRWCPSCNSPSFQSPYGKIRIAMETSLDSSPATPPTPSLPPVSPFFMVMVPGIP